MPLFPIPGAAAPRSRLTLILATTAILLAAGCAWVGYALLGAKQEPLLLPPATMPSTVPATLSYVLASEVPMSGTPPDRFSMKGVQVGDLLPVIALLDAQQRPAAVVPATDKPYTVVVTGSLTCPIARLTLPKLAALAQRRSDLAVQVVYVIEPHPLGDPSPYRDREWVTNDNLRDHILVRQPTTLAARVALATQFQAHYAPSFPLLLDGLDNRSWQAYGAGPNLALVVDPQGRVRYKQGWLEVDKLDAWLTAQATTQAGAAAPGGTQ